MYEYIADTYIEKQSLVSGALSVAPVHSDTSEFLAFEPRGLIGLFSTIVHGKTILVCSIFH